MSDMSEWYGDQIEGEGPTGDAKYLVFDVESTGLDVFEDRIVQLFIATADEDGELLDYWEWVIDPGVEVPEGAAEVHGFTTEYLRKYGGDPVDSLRDALGVFEAYGDLVWVAYNLNYDASILGADLERHGVYRYWSDMLLGDPEDVSKATLFDPLVVDRAKDKYRKGKRKLENVAAHYGIPFDPEAAHNAKYDVEVTAKVAAAVAKRYGIPSNAEQAEMYRTWAVGLEEYLRRSDDSARVDSNWPLKLKEEA